MTNLVPSETFGGQEVELNVNSYIYLGHENRITKTTKPVN